MFGRKLDMVCSTQPYGKDVRYSSAPNKDPAIDGDTRSDIEREPGWALPGNVRSNIADPPGDPAAAMDPPRACESFTPAMFTGRSNCRASDSSLVRALPRI